MQRAHGPTCDGCHSVDYNIRQASRRVECRLRTLPRPGSEHVEQATRGNILNPRAWITSTDRHCIQCHSQGRLLSKPKSKENITIGPSVSRGFESASYWQLEDHKLASLTFTHFPDGTAHKNRMQGNDFRAKRDVPPRRHLFDCMTCTALKYAQLRNPQDQICMELPRSRFAKRPARGDAPSIRITKKLPQAAIAWPCQHAED